MQYLRPQLPQLSAPVVVSHSEVESAARCPFQHQIQYRERWSRPTSTDSAAGKGIAWHEVLEGHYRCIQAAQQEAEALGDPWWTFDQDQALREAQAVVELTIRDYENRSLELGELLSWMYAGHVQMWGADPDWRIWDVERSGVVDLAPPVAVLLPSLFDPSDTAEGDFQFKYRADLVIEINGKLWIVDHKSNHNFPSALDLDFDSQFDRYTWAMRAEGLGIFGQMFNMARRRMLKRPQELEERFRRQMTHRTEKELDKIAEDLFLTIYWRYAQLMGMERDAEALLQGIGVDPAQVAPADAPRQMSSRHCSHLCDLTEPCIAGRKGNDSRQFLAELGFEQSFVRH